ncbi:MAG TPA: GNAT family N-acetyltransferase [Phenylobacterium sp.]|uniref:GNAT family N-acetyltransferase n=1 Tax=Phenylobacterium sp. TaxID=1871053 RepID=UPI002D71166D|nr:GNAT family N-acetyltransferase [Phenylobacterium sp.]HZZ67498.1 GNAT family N-acetyltransferase [Phenylobacterium sp.]
MEAAGVAILERDTVAAVAPPELLEIGGWLVPLDDGTIGRAKSAVPLRHDVGLDALGEIEDAYRRRGLKPAFRIADVPSLAPVCAELTRRGFAPQQPTIFKTGSVSRLAAFSDAPARVLETPDAAWAGVFLGDGFDPVDGVHRVAALTRSPGAIYGAAGQGGATHAVGVMSFGVQWVGIHGMRTAPAHRGHGHAGAILAALGRAALGRGRTQVFLQVEEANPARRIYRAAGFAPIWRYHYWR